MRLFVLSIFFFVTWTLNAQQYADPSYYLVDSLILEDISDSNLDLLELSLKKYHKSNSDTAKIKSIENIVENCWDGNVWPKYNLWIYNFCREKLKQKLTREIKKEVKTSLASAINNIGFHCGEIGDISCQMTNYFTALQMLIDLEDKKGVATGLNNIGYIYFSSGNIEKALEFYDRSLKLRKELDDKSGVAESYNNIANVYDNQNEPEKALEFYNQAMSIYEINGDSYGVASILNNVGYIYLLSNDSKNALLNFTKSLSIREKLGYKIGVSQSLNNIGYVYQNKGELDSALYYFQKSLEIKEEVSHKQGIAVSLNNIGAIELQKGQIKQAQLHSERSLILAKELGYPEDIYKAAKNLSNIYEQQNKGIEALNMYKLYIEMRDSLNNEATQKATLQQQAKYEYEKQKVLDDAQNEKLLAIEKEEKEKQKIVSYAIGFGLFLVVVFLIFIFNRLQITKKQKKVIETQKEEVESQKEIIEETHKEITDSINYAKRLQDAILPSIDTVNQYLPHNFILFQPKDVVSGDFYWFEHINNISYIAVADCTGHGVPGAMVSVVCSNALNRSVKEFGIAEPSKILDKTRELVIETFAKSGTDVKDGMDIALCAFSENKVVYSGANNPLWIIRKTSQLTELQKTQKSTIIEDEKALIEFKPNKQPIGLYANMTPFKSQSIELFEGDCLYFFTDGYADQFGGDKGKKMKYKPFKNLLLSLQNLPMTAQKQELRNSFLTWKGEIEQIDDVCIIGVKIS